MYLTIICICVAYLFLSIARGEREPAFGYTTEFYALLAQSFLHGTTSLSIQPDPELLALPNPYVPNAPHRLHDASLYNGRYYLYFGPVPALTLFVPYRLLTRSDLPNRVAVPLFCIGAYLSSCALFFRLARRNAWILPFWMRFVAVSSLGSMSLVSLVLRRPSFYEVAVAGGYFFVLAGFLALERAYSGTTADLKMLCLAGFLFGASVGCRPHFVVICVIVLTTHMFFARKNPVASAAMAATMALCAIALGWYNYARFQNAFEFGVTYQLASFSQQALQHNLGVAWRTGTYFLFTTPHVDRTPPFIHTVFIYPLAGLPGEVKWTEDMVGLFPAAPFAMLGCFMPFMLLKRVNHTGMLDDPSQWILWAMYLSAVVVFLVLCGLGWVIGRYIVDFGPLLTMQGVVMLAMLWQRLRESPRAYLFQWGATATAVYGLLFNAAIATPRLDLVMKFLHRIG